jgi:hypothetical protein
MLGIGPVNGPQPGERLSHALAREFTMIASQAARHT